MVKDAVRKVAKNLYDPAGGIIAQFEVGPGANPANAMVALDEWAAVHEVPSGKPVYVDVVVRATFARPGFLGWLPGSSTPSQWRARGVSLPLPGANRSLGE